MNLPTIVKNICEKLERNNHPTYIVGGAVRDFILGKEPKDFDIATSATPDEIIDILSEYHLDTVGKAFGVVLVKKDNESYEIATFRKDTTVGRNPVVEFPVYIEDDVKRRDFTINSMYFDWKNNQIVDLFGGKVDLKDKILRTIGNPFERFGEDALRKLRAIRFIVKYGLTPEKSLLDCLLNDNSLEGVSQERVISEFFNSISYSFENTIYWYRKFRILDKIGLDENILVFEKNPILCYAKFGFDSERLKSLLFPNYFIALIEWQRIYNKGIDKHSLYILKRDFDNLFSHYYGKYLQCSEKFRNFAWISYSEEAISLGKNGKEISDYIKEKNFLNYTATI